MNPKKALQKIKEYLKEVEFLLNKSCEEGSDQRDTLNLKIKGFIRQIFKDDHDRLNSYNHSIFNPYSSGAYGEKEKHYRESLQNMKSQLIGFQEELEIIKNDSKPSNNLNRNNTIDNLMKVFSRFDIVVNQLSKKHRSKNTFVIENEYDVQYLIHALLKIFFDDISPEVAVPGDASGHTFMDFLLKSEGIAIEIKMTRKNLSNTELRKQLNDDIGAYKKHSNCNTTLFFIYDPDHRIENPRGFENEFNNMNTVEHKIKVYISPQ